MSESRWRREINEVIVIVLFLLSFSILSWRLMRRSIRNFNTPPPGRTPGVPRAYPGHLTVHRAQGGGNLNVALKRWGIWTGFISCSDVRRQRVFSVFAGMTDFQDRISPFLVNNSFKRSLKVSLRHISLWKAWTVFDFRRNLSLRRVISVLVCGEFERLFCPDGREFEQANNLQQFKCRGGCPGGGMLNFRIDRRIIVYCYAFNCFIRPLGFSRGRVLSGIMKRKGTIACSIACT